MQIIWSFVTEWTHPSPLALHMPSKAPSRAIYDVLLYHSNERQGHSEDDIYDYHYYGKLITLPTQQDAEVLNVKQGHYWAEWSHLRSGSPLELATAPCIAQKSGVYSAKFPLDNRTHADDVSGAACGKITLEDNSGGKSTVCVKVVECTLLADTTRSHATIL